MHKPHDKLITALVALDKLDSDMASVRAEHGNPTDRFENGGFAAIVRIILGQQISNKVAATLWARLVEKKWTTATPLSQCDYEDLQRLGLSRRKAEYIIDLARAQATGTLQLAKLNKKPADEFNKILTSYRGIGAWSASNYRLFCLADLDAWPGNDLALMEALKLMKGLKTRPTHSEMDQWAEKWRPYRGAAALMLWHFYAKTVRNARPIG